jgi:F-type H+-transporting ATPase subunit b
MMISILLSAPLFIFAAENIYARWFNVIVFFGILFMLLRKPTRTFFTERFAQIRASLEKAAKEKAEAQSHIQSIDARLASLDAEAVKIKETAKQESAAEVERLKAQTNAEIEKIKETAHREIESAKQIALVELRQYTAASAVSMAEQLIRKELSSDDDAALLQRAGAEMKTM